MASDGLRPVESVRFQPVVCSVRGKLRVGAACGDAMPAKATVRLTEAGELSGHEMEIARSSEPFTGDSKPFPAPYAPACCMYNTCIGRTVPYWPVRVGRNSVIESTKTILAVWPADAEIALVPMGSESAGAASGAWDGHCDAQLGHCFLLSTSDVDGDGRLELLVYEQWANDYGLAVRGDGGKTELYRFSCGNI